MLLRFPIRAALLCAALAASPSHAQYAAPPQIAMNDSEKAAPDMPELLSMRERAEVIDRILAKRLDTVVPQIMREEGIDMWVLMAREYFEEPVIATMWTLSRWIKPPK